jgi:hypothetical protein
LFLSKKISQKLSKNECSNNIPLLIIPEVAHNCLDWLFGCRFIPPIRSLSSVHVFIKQSTRAAVPFATHLALMCLCYMERKESMPIQKLNAVPASDVGQG